MWADGIGLGVGAVGTKFASKVSPSTSVQRRAEKTGSLLVG